jgi:hypothetical protein
VTAPASPPTNVTTPPAIDQEASPHHEIPPLDSEDDVVEDFEDDDVEDVPLPQKKKARYWAVDVIGI